MKIEKKRKSKENNFERKGKIDSYLNGYKGLFIILILSLILYAYTFDMKLDLNGDNVRYYLLGKAIAEGKGFSSIWLPDSPPHTYWPIGYPIIISVVMKLGITSITAIKISNYIFLLGIIIFFFCFVNNITKNKTVSIVSTLILGINTHMLHYAYIMMAEIPFLFFSILSLYFISKIDFKVPIYKNCFILASIFTMTFSFYIKSIGFVILFAVLIYYLIYKQWKVGLFTLCGFIILYSPYYLRNYLLGVKGSTYIKSLIYKNPYRKELGMMGIGDYIERIFNNLQRYISIEIPSSILTFIDPYKGSIISGFIGMVFLLIVIWGLVHLKKYRILIATLFIGILGILLLWPEVWYGTRFLLILLPLIIFLIIHGIYILSTKYKVNPNFLFGLGILYFLIHISSYSYLNKKSCAEYPANYANYFKIAHWADQNTNSDDIFITRKPQFFYLFSNRKAISYKSTLDDKELISDLEMKNSRYVIIEQLGSSSTLRYLVPAIQKNLDRFELVINLKNPDTCLLKFKDKI